MKCSIASDEFAQRRSQGDARTNLENISNSRILSNVKNTCCQFTTNCLRKTTHLQGLEQVNSSAPVEFKIHLNALFKESFGTSSLITHVYSTKNIEAFWSIRLGFVINYNFNLDEFSRGAVEIATFSNPSLSLQTTNRGLLYANML